MSRRLLPASVVAAFVLAALVPSAPAQTFAPIYGIRHTKPPEIWSIDLATGHATFVSSNMRQTKVACARHPRTGQIWLFSNVTPNKISVWDPATDQETTIHSGPNVQFHRVGFDADCTLYGVPLNSNVLYTIDTTNGNLTKLGGLKTVDPAGDGGDIAFPPGVTSWFTYLAGSKLYRIDLPSLQGTLILDPIGFKATGAAYTADGRLWVTSDTDLYEGDPLTGAMRLVGGFGMKQILDLCEDLSPMYLGVTPPDPAPGATLDLWLRQGAAGQPAAVVLTNLGGAPTFQLLLVGVFDAAGEWSLQDTVPPGLSGLSIGLTGIGFAANGDLLLTNTQEVVFQ